MYKIIRELKVVVSRLKGGNRGEKYQQFPKSVQTLRVRKYWWTVKETRKLDAARRKRGGKGLGKCATRGWSSLVWRWWKRSSICGSKKKVSRGGRGGEGGSVSGWNIELWTGENKVRRNGGALGNDDGGRTVERVGRGTGSPWVIAATICSSGRIYFYRYNLLREIKYFENKREDAIEPRDIVGHLFRAGYASKRAHPLPQNISACVHALISSLQLVRENSRPLRLFVERVGNWGSLAEKHRYITRDRERGRCNV